MKSALTFTISATDEGIKLARWMRQKYPLVTRDNFYKLCRLGDIRLNGRKTDGQEKLNLGDTVTLPSFLEKLTVNPEEQTIAPKWLKEIKSAILFEDEDLIILNKPAGLACQRGTNTPLALDDILRRLYPEHPPRLVHRLDKETSGLLIVAKNLKAAQILALDFQTRAIKKSYHALVIGVPPKTSGQIHSTDAQDKDCVTAYHSEKKIPDLGLTLLRLDPLTGRKHQLRRQCAYILKTPLVGDTLYGKDRLKEWVKRTGLKLPLALVSDHLAFIHPRTKQELAFSIPLPPFFEDLIHA